MSEITIVPYSEERAPAFDRLNREWIEKFFWIEPFDEQMLTRPKELIIDKGGELWFAEMDGEVVAACALLHYAPGIYEFSKLGVDKKARGRKIGQKLLRHCKERAKALGATDLYIFTSSSLKTANELYREEQFQDLPLSDEEKKRYKRADVFLTYPLQQESSAA